MRLRYHNLKSADGLLSGMSGFQKLSDNFLGSALSDSLVRELLDNLDNLMSLGDGSGMLNLSSTSNLSDELDMSSHHLVESLDDTRVVGETVSLHNME